jgi:ABC-2 type transport system permease protein
VPEGQGRLSRWLTVASADLDDSIARRDLWIHQGLIDVLRRYRRTRIGPFWHTLQLGAMIVLLGFVWSALFKIDPGSYFLSLTPTLIVWTLISTIVVDGCAVLVAAQATALSIRFPYTAFVFAHLWRALLVFGHHLILLVLIYAAFLRVPGTEILLAVPALLLILVNGFWITLLLSVATLKARDVQQVVASGMQIAMFATPVFWPRELLGPQFAALVDYNPLYHLLRLGRDPFVGQVPPLESWLWAIGMGVVGVMAALFVFGRVRHRLAYWY